MPGGQASEGEKWRIRFSPSASQPPVRTHLSAEVCPHVPNFPVGCPIPSHPFPSIQLVNTLTPVVLLLPQPSWTVYPRIIVMLTSICQISVLPALSLCCLPSDLAWSSETFVWSCGATWAGQCVVRRNFFLFFLVFIAGLIPRRISLGIPGASHAKGSAPYSRTTRPATPDEQRLCVATINVAH